MLKKARILNLQHPVEGWDNFVSAIVFKECMGGLLAEIPGDVWWLSMEMSGKLDSVIGQASAWGNQIRISNKLKANKYNFLWTTSCAESVNQKRGLQIEKEFSIASPRI